MGYTHHWNKPKPTRVEIWADLINLVAIVVKFCEGEGIPLVNGVGDEASQPIFDMGRIMFNGVGEEAHETFIMGRIDLSRGSCKTAYKPYDLAVCLALIAAKKVLGKEITIKSDGDANDWDEAFNAAERVFSIRAGFMVSERDPHGNPTEWTVEVF